MATQEQFNNIMNIFEYILTRIIHLALLRVLLGHSIEVKFILFILIFACFMIESL